MCPDQSDRTELANTSPSFSFCESILTFVTLAMHCICFIKHSKTKYFAQNKDIDINRNI